MTLARPELSSVGPNWGTGHRLLTAMPLDPLPEASMRELLAGLVPGLPDQAVEAILDRADGIPLYAVETVRMLRRRGPARGSRRRLSADGRRSMSWPSPRRCARWSPSRLDALDPADRSLLQDAAVLGQRFTTCELGGRCRA